MRESSSRCLFPFSFYPIVASQLKLALLGDLPGCIRAQWRTTKLVKPSGKAKRKRVVQEQRPFPEGFLWAVSASTRIQ